MLQNFYTLVQPKKQPSSTNQNAEFCQMNIKITRELFGDGNKTTSEKTASSASIREESMRGSQF